MNPTSLTLFTYNVGFGDCFLLRFGYPDRNRHVLIDFGTSALPARADDRMEQVASDIASRCDGKLEAIVVTHRHLDHLSGFGNGTWPTIAALKPKLVLLPWTEDPDAATNARRATRPGAGPQKLTDSLCRIQALRAMREVAGAAVAELKKRGDPKVVDKVFAGAGADAVQAEGADDAASGEAQAVVPFSQTLTRKLAFLGQTNLGNEDAVTNLMSLKREFLCFGQTTSLETLLPGTKISVLGPPTLEQCPDISRQRSKDADEFWKLAAGAGTAVVDGKRPFPRVRPLPLDRKPLEMRWFFQRMNALRGEELLELVRILDKQMNNTSLILLFEACGKKLLFPGDAQIENWSFALGKAQVRKQLADVDLYKVGHHGSGNATPLSLWKLFTKKGPAKKLVTVLSTKSKKHPGVPRPSLVEALRAQTRLVSTQDSGQEGKKTAKGKTAGEMPEWVIPTEIA